MSSSPISSAALGGSAQTLLNTLLTHPAPSTGAGVSARTHTLLVNLDELQGGISNRAALYDAAAMQTLSSRATHHASPSNGGGSSPRARASPGSGAGASAAAAAARGSPSPSFRELSASSASSPRTARSLQLEGGAGAAAADPFLTDPALKQRASEVLAVAEATATLLPASPATPAGGAGGGSSSGGGNRAALMATVAAMEAELAALKLQLAAADAPATSSAASSLD
jgi:hypothetical protein